MTPIADPPISIIVRLTSDTSSQITINTIRINRTGNTRMTSRIEIIAMHSTLETHRSVGTLNAPRNNGIT